MFDSSKPSWGWSHLGSTSGRRMGAWRSGPGDPDQEKTFFEAKFQKSPQYISNNMFPPHSLKFTAPETPGVHTNNSVEFSLPIFSGSCPESGSTGLNSIGIWTGPHWEMEAPGGAPRIFWKRKLDRVVCMDSVGLWSCKFERMGWKHVI